MGETQSRHFHQPDDALGGAGRGTEWSMALLSQPLAADPCTTGELRPLPNNDNSETSKQSAAAAAISESGGPSRPACRPLSPRQVAPRPCPTPPPQPTPCPRGRPLPPLPPATVSSNTLGAQPQSVSPPSSVNSSQCSGENSISTSHVGIAYEGVARSPPRRTSTERASATGMVMSQRSSRLEANECGIPSVTVTDSEWAANQAPGYDSETIFQSGAASPELEDSTGALANAVKMLRVAGPSAAGVWGAVKVGLGIGAIVAGHAVIGGEKSAHPNFNHPFRVGAMLGYGAAAVLGSSIWVGSQLLTGGTDSTPRITTEAAAPDSPGPDNRRLHRRSYSDDFRYRSRRSRSGDRHLPYEAATEPSDMPDRDGARSQVKNTCFIGRKRSRRRPVSMTSAGRRSTRELVKAASAGLSPSIALSDANTGSGGRSPAQPDVHRRRAARSAISLIDSPQPLSANVEDHVALMLRGRRSIVSQSDLTTASGPAGGQLENSAFLSPVSPGFNPSSSKAPINSQYFPLAANGVQPEDSPKERRARCGGLGSVVKSAFVPGGRRGDGSPVAGYGDSRRTPRAAGRLRAAAGFRTVANDRCWSETAIGSAVHHGQESSSPPRGPEY